MYDCEACRSKIGCTACGKIQRLHVELEELAKNEGDTEIDHGRADDIVEEILRLLGYKEIADLYEKVDKWYA